MSSSGISLPLKTEHSIKDRLYWNFLNVIPFLIGSIAIIRDSIKWVAVYIGIALFFLPGYRIQVRMYSLFLLYPEQRLGKVHDAFWSTKNF